MKKRKKRSTEPVDIPQMPFDDALRKILSAPPQPMGKIKKKTKKK